jgi:hypothetical protein
MLTQIPKNHQNIILKHYRNVKVYVRAPMIATLFPDILAKRMVSRGIAIFTTVLLYLI